MNATSERVSPDCNNMDENGTYVENACDALLLSFEFFVIDNTQNTNWTSNFILGIM